MPDAAARPPRTATTWTIAVVALLVGLNAVVAGTMLVVRPDGSLVGFTPALLAGTPFDSYVVPGLLLAVVVGGTQLVAGALVLARARRARPAAMLAGAVTIGWIAGQVILLGYLSLLQPAVAVAGAAVLLLATRLRR